MASVLMTADPASLPEWADSTDKRIARMVLDGASNKDIAKELDVSIATVKWRLYRLYKAVGVSSRTQFVLRLRKH